MQISFLAAIRSLPSSVPWSSVTEQIYLAGLRNVPDQDLPMLSEAVLATRTYRPTLHELKQIYSSITGQNASRSADEVVAQIYALRDKHGEYAVKHPTLPLMQAGEPAWTDAVMRRTIAAMGGWVAFCRETTEAGVQRGQLMRAAQMALDGQGDETINRLRLEYREQNPSLPCNGFALNEPNCNEPPQLSSLGDAMRGLIPARNKPEGVDN